jgi:hypothetical protein
MLSVYGRDNNVSSSVQRAWLRDRRADTYISIFRLFKKTPDQVSQDEWEHLMATVRAFASQTVTDLRMVSGRHTRTRIPLSA